MSFFIIFLILTNIYFINYYMIGKKGFGFECLNLNKTKYSNKNKYKRIFIIRKLIFVFRYGYKNI